MVDVFHIGYHKTGTTFLQRELFSKHSNIHLRKTGKLLCSEDFEKSRYVEAGNRKKVRKVTVESYEGLSGGQVCVGNAFVMPGRIYSINPQAKVLIFTRKPETYRVAVYRQHVQQGGILTQGEFLSSLSFLLIS